MFREFPTPRIAVAVDELAGTPTAGQVWVADPVSCNDFALNQFVLFLKPEVTAVAEGARFAEICETLLGTLADHAVEIHAVRVVNGAFLQRERIMERHYGVIGAISRLGEPALSRAARAVLRDCFPDSADVLGGHQFLARYPDFSAGSLATLFGDVENVRLGSGAYAGEVRLPGREVVLLNGFHPRQLERFTRPGAVVVILEGRTTTPWSVLRRRVVGVTNAATAAPGSLRRTLFDRSGEFGLSGRSNGLHISAGPLEGLVEIRRFFGEGVACFDRALLDSGLSVDQVARLAENPGIPVDGRVRSAFDLTEEMDSIAAARVLRTAVGLLDPP